MSKHALDIRPLVRRRTVLALRVLTIILAVATPVTLWADRANGGDAAVPYLTGEFVALTALVSLGWGSRRAS